MKVRIRCENDDNITKLGWLDMENLPNAGDTIIIDGVPHLVTGRTHGVGSEFTEAGIYGVVVDLKRK